MRSGSTDELQFEEENLGLLAASSRLEHAQPCAEDRSQSDIGAFANDAASYHFQANGGLASRRFDTKEKEIALGMAHWLYRMRASRVDRLGVAAFAEPGWDLLLDLYISRAANRSLSVTAACIGSRASAATAIRYLGMLCEAGLLERRPDEHDSRRSFVRLTDRGWHRMTALLLDP